MTGAPNMCASLPLAAANRVRNRWQIMQLWYWRAQGRTLPPQGLTFAQVLLVVLHSGKKGRGGEGIRSLGESMGEIVLTQCSVHPNHPHLLCDVVVPRSLDLRHHLLTGEPAGSRKRGQTDAGQSQGRAGQGRAISHQGRAGRGASHQLTFPTCRWPASR